MSRAKYTLKEILQDIGGIIGFNGTYELVARQTWREFKEVKATEAGETMWQACRKATTQAQSFRDHPELRDDLNYLTPELDKFIERARINESGLYWFIPEKFTPADMIAVRRRL